MDSGRARAVPLEVAVLELHPGLAVRLGFQDGLGELGAADVVAVWPP